MAFGPLRNFNSHRDAERTVVEKGVPQYSATVYEGREVEVGLKHPTQFIPIPFSCIRLWSESDWTQFARSRRLDPTFQTLESVTISAPWTEYAAVTNSPRIL